MKIREIRLRLQLACAKQPLDRERLDKAAQAVAETRHTWGWCFGKRSPKALAIDFLMAEAAICAYSPAPLVQEEAK